METTRNETISHLAEENLRRIKWLHSSFKTSTSYSKQIALLSTMVFSSGSLSLFGIVLILFVCFMKWTYSYWDCHGFKTLPD